MQITVPATGNSDPRQFNGGWATAFCQGSNFNSGTVALQARLFGTNIWLPVKNVAGEAIQFTENGYENFAIAGQIELRAAVTGSGLSGITMTILTGATGVRAE